MILDERKRRILQAIVDDYIDTAEPVGSRTIARKHELGFSSATIRNEMADLEEMGYISQPYTSAGRIPSDKGYRLYVDQLMKIRQLTEDEIRLIKDAMEVKIDELCHLIKQAAMVISRFTRYTSMAITPQLMKSSIKTIQLVPIDPGKLLLIVVTNTGVIKNMMVKVAETITSDSAIRISNMLNDKLCGLMLEKINYMLISDIEKEIFMPKDILLPIWEALINCINQIISPEIYLDGATNILNFPEFKDIVKAREFLSMLDEKDLLCKILSYSYDNGRAINIKIGSENDIEEMKECSLITTTYSVENKVIGSVGVIGPTRMEYARVISSLNYIKSKINEELYKLIGEYLDEE